MPFDGKAQFQFGIGDIIFNRLGKEGRGKHDSLIPLDKMVQKIKKLEHEWEMIDAIKPLSMVHVDFSGGGNGSLPTIQFRSKNQIGKECLITRQALRQLSEYMAIRTSTGRNVKPFNLTEARCMMGDDMRKLETMAWSYQLDKNDHEVMFRSKILNGGRVITSIQGVGYAPIKDSQLLSRLDMQNKFVTQFTIGSKFSHYGIVEGMPKMKDLSKMIEIHNSDSGTRGLSALEKYYIQICTNGMMGWRNKAKPFYNRHFGDSDIIADAFADYVSTKKDDGDDFIQVYEKARNIELDNLWATFQFRGGKFSKEEGENIRLSIGASKFIASPINSLGHLIDAMTLSAQANIDPMERMLVEQKATDFMFSAIEDFDNGKELVPAKFLESLA